MNWLKKLPLFKVVYRQGGIDSFALAQKDILETMADDLDEKAEELAKQKLNDLLSSIDLHKIVTLNKQAGIVYIGGERAEEGRLSNLKSEAEFIANSELWQLLMETPKSLAERAMFISGEGLDDMKKGRSILYTLSAQKNVVDVLKSYIPRKPLADKNDAVV